MIPKRNARFWIWYTHGQTHGWVKLTLKPGDAVEFASGGRHEEGWSSCQERCEHEGESVLREVHDDGVDCDGRLERFSEGSCPLGSLMANDAFDSYPVAENIGIWTPEWTEGSTSQRDYAAEAAGY